MGRKLSVLTKACASTDTGGTLASVVMVVLLATIAVGCTTNRCHKRRNCTQCNSRVTTCDVPGCGAADPTTTKDVDIAPRRGAFGHGENYEWLIGKLQRVHVPRKGWKIRYAPIDEKERYGGSVVLAPDIRLEKYKDGDVVYVEGEILGDRASLYLAGARYRVRTIRRATEKDIPRVALGKKANIK